MPKYSDSVNRRRDDRTLKQFKEDIKFRTAKEKFLVKLYQKEMKYRKFNLTVRNYGVDNTGEFVEKSNCKPDYKLIFHEKSIETGKGMTVEYLVEVKCSPVNKWTFKIYHLKQYVKLNANILIFWNVGYIDKDPKTINYDTAQFGIIATDKIQLILDSYKPYNEPTFGNKECIRLYEKDFYLFCYPQGITHRK